MARKQTPVPAGKTDAPTEPLQSDDQQNGLREALEKKIGPLVPQAQRAEIVQRVYAILVSEKFSGPLPHPRHLREYEDILPGAAERIIRMAEESLDHNRSMDRKVIQDDADDRRRGMNYGMAAFVAALVGAGIMGAINQPGVAVAFLAATVIGAVAVFVKGRLGE